MIQGGYADLLEIIAALNTVGRFPDFLNGRKQEADQGRDYCHDHQQLHERKARSIAVLAAGDRPAAGVARAPTQGAAFWPGK
jgi:hypothetical protein